MEVEERSRKILVKSREKMFEQHLESVEEYWGRYLYNVRLLLHLY